MRIDETNRTYRAVYGEQVSLVHFAPLEVITRGDVRVDFGDAEVMARLLPSIQEWVRRSRVNVIRGHETDRGDVLGDVLDALVNTEAPAGPDDLMPGWFAVVRWTDDAWPMIERRKIPAVSMRLQLEAPDHTGRIWPAILRHIAVVDEPLFALGQQAPVDLAASAVSAGSASQPRGLLLTASLVHEGAGMEEALKQVMEMIEALVERIAAIEARHKEDEEMSAKEGEDMKAEDKPKEEDMSASTGAGVSKELLAQLDALKARATAAEKAQQTEAQRAEAAEAKLARKNAEELVASAVAVGKVDKDKSNSVVASAIKDYAGTKAILDAITPRTDFGTHSAGPARESSVGGGGELTASAEIRARNEAAAEARKNGWTLDQENVRFGELYAQYGGE